VITSSSIPGNLHNAYPLLVISEKTKNADLINENTAF